MTQVFSPNDTGVRDFTNNIEVKFRIDDDVFLGVRNIPALSLMQFGVLFQGLSESDIAGNPDTFVKMFNLVLEEASAQRFIERMGSKTDPISLDQVMNILPWVMEKYGMRPTEPSSESSPGSSNPGDGTSLTVNGSTQASTSTLSLQPSS